MTETKMTEGLTTKEVQSRVEKGLVNKTQDKVIKSNWQILFNNLFTLFNAFNFSIALALFLVGAYTNLFFIVIIIMNISIGTLQEIHAKKLVEKLTILSATKAVVIRDSKKTEIPTDDIVQDDMIIYSEGNQISSDSILLEGEVEVNESLLTGEADNILKSVGGTLLSGSYVVSGTCYARVKNVGAENYVAKITSKVKKHKKIKSELLDAMNTVTKFTSLFIIPLGVILLVQSYYFRNETFAESVISSSAGLLGMLPKGLLLLISLTLATGVIKLSRKKVLIQEMHSIETMAHVDMLCLDKTGTITEGNMKVSNLHIIDDSSMPISVKEAMECFSNNMENNNATFAALKKEFETDDTTYNLLNKVPFSSDRKWSSATFSSIGSLVLGAPEKLLQCSDFTLPNEIVEAQKSGKRILLLGYTKETIRDRELLPLIIVAAIELDDPLKKNAKEMFHFFKSEGVDIKVISGDNTLTVSSIAKKAGIENYDSYIDMSNVTDEEIKDIVNKYVIFGRVNPNQKSLIVKALQNNGHTVAMTGDGVNDVIALREADCGITMPNGSDVAKQVSQIVLLDSDFGVLKDVLMEGRRVVNNVTNVAKIFFIKTIYSVLLCILNIILNVPFPFIPIQITLIDLAIEGYTPFFTSFESDNRKIQAPFLQSVIRGAMPYAITIILSLIGIMLVAPSYNIVDNEMVTIMYYIIGFISILAVIKSCYPFNKLRIFLATTTAIGFYVAAFLFQKLLHLEKISSTGLWMCIIVAMLCIPIKMLLAHFIDYKIER